MMRKGNRITLLITVLCILSLLISVLSTVILAADAGGITVSASTSSTVRQGGTGYCYVQIDSLKSLSSLDVAVHYDPDKISVTSSFNQVSNMLYDSSIQESYVQYSYIFDGEGAASKTQLFYFQYQVLTNAEVGDAYFDVVVGEAFDASLNVVDVGGSRCTFTITQTVVDKTCGVSGISSVSSMIGGEFELSYSLNTREVASGSFVVRYDPELLEVVEVTNGGLLANKIVDINTELAGAVYVSFVGTEYTNSAQLLTLKLRTIKNTTETTQVKLSVTDFYDVELSSIGCGGYTSRVNLSFDPTYSEHAPNMIATATYAPAQNQVTVTIRLEAQSRLGAGDFTLGFDPAYFSYRSATKGFSPTFFNINDKKVAEGVLKFSVISLTDIVTEETVLSVVFDTPVFCLDIEPVFTLSGSGLTDAMTESILLNFVDAPLPISGVGHDTISHDAKAPTCTEIGWHAYETCSRCDYTTYVEIPANGHSFVRTVCSVCGERQPVYKSMDISAAADGSLIANLYQNTVEGGYELEIIGTGEMAEWSSVSSVPWYAQRGHIKYLTIGNGPTSISTYAFCGLSALRQATLPEGIERIGTSAFSGCAFLAEVNIPESVTSIGNNAFYNCRSLTALSFNAAAMQDLANGNGVFYNAGTSGEGLSVTFGASVTAVPAYLFYPTGNSSYAPKITSVTFAEGSVCKTIGEYAFYRNKSLTELTLPEGLETVGIYAFYECQSLTELTIPEGATTIGTCAFYGCTALTSLTIPESVTTIGTYALYNCRLLTTLTFNAAAMQDLTNGNLVFAYAGAGGDGIAVTFGASVTAVPAYLFYPTSGESYLPKITSVTFAEGSVCKTIGEYAFYWSRSLTELTLPEGLETVGIYSFYECQSLTELTIPEGAATIGAYAFYGCTALTSLTIPEGATTIGTYAFCGCTALTSLTIPEGATTIGTYAFCGCTALTSLTILEGVTTIGAYAFYGCTALTSLTIPESVTTIGTYAFYNCRSLTTLTFNAAAMQDLASYNYVFTYAGVDGDGIAVTFGASVTAVPAYLFCPESGLSYIPKITSVTFAEGAVCKTIGEYAFYWSRSLTELTLPEGLETVGIYAFYECQSLTELTIPEGATTIGTCAFYGCTALTSLTIPESVTTIGTYAFYNCRSLTTLTFNAAVMQDLTNGNLVFAYAGAGGDGIAVTFGAPVTAVPAYLFYPTGNSSYAPKITSVTFAEGSVCKTIGEYAFYYCQFLTVLTLPEGLETIGTYAFYGCSGLRYVMVPDSVTALGACALYSGSRVVIGFAAEALPASLGSSWKSSDAVYYLNVEELVSINDAVYAVLEDDTALIAGYYGAATTYQILSTVNGVGVVAIGEKAFYGNTVLQTVIIPASVTSIGNHALSYCAKLTIGFAAAELPATLGSSWNSGSGYYLDVKEFVLFDDATYVITNDGVAKLGRYHGAGAEYTILDAVNGVAVSGIGDYAFYSCRSLQRMFVGEAITSIGKYAFYDCLSLLYVIIPESVTSIGTLALSNCGRALLAFRGSQLPQNLEESWSDGRAQYLGVRELLETEDAIYVVLADDTAAFGRYLGNGTEYTVLDTVSGAVVTHIGLNAFQSATTLTLVTLPETLTTIGTQAFYACGALEEICIPTNVTTIGSSAFYGCKVLQSITIPTGVTSIAAYTFYGCSALQSVILPEGLTRIANQAFYQCIALESVTIPAGMKVIEGGAFQNCTALREIHFDAVEMNGLGSGNYVFYNAGVNGEGITVTIGAAVTWIPAYLFYPCSTYVPKITAVVFEGESACDYIGNYAFAHAVYLTELTLPDNISAVRSYAFYGCTSLAQLHLGSNLTSIGNNAFEQAALTTLTIPAGVNTIGSDAFRGVLLRLVRIDSQTIARAISSSTACGQLLGNTPTVAVFLDSSATNAYIPSTYTNAEQITYNGAAATVYSMHTHTWEEDEVLVPFIACVQDGCIRYACAECGAYKDVTTFKHGVITHAALEPTCTTVGWHQYDTCYFCDYTTYVELPALGHRVMVDGRVFVDSITAENDGSYPFTLIDNVYYSTNNKDNTDSYFKITALYDCTLSISYAVSSEAKYDKIYIRQNGNILVDVSGEVAWTSKEIALSAGDVVTINYHKDGSQSTGKDTGWFSFSCTQSEIDGLVEAPADDADPTCTDAVVCHFCKAIVKEALGHSYTQQIIAPGCTTAGYTHHTCETCGDTKATDFVAALGHTPGEWLTDKEATCTSIGYQHKECTVCETILETAQIGMIAHTEAIDPAVEATCTATGLTQGAHCAVCDTVLVEQTVVGKKPHTPGGWLTDKEATCTSIGYQHKECTVCETILETAQIAALGHNTLSHSSKAATCTENGWHAYVTCSRCDYTTFATIPAYGHSEVSHEAKTPSCTEIGWEAYVTCVRCDYTTYRERAARGHNEVSHAAKAASCTEIGWEAYVTCTRCDYTTYAEIAALGHDEVAHDAKEPDCTEVGWNAYVTCSRCSYTTYKELAALGHRVLVEGKVWVDSIDMANDKAYPFGRVNGVYTSTNKAHNSDSYFTVTALYDCTLRIAYAVSSEQNYDKLIIRKNGSILVTISGTVDWSARVIELAAGDVVTINYHKDGSVNVANDEGCFELDCTQTEIDSITVIPAESVTPTCTEPVLCDCCGAVAVAALGHNEITHNAKAPTCTSIGWEAYVTCSRCDYTTYAELAALGHDEISHEEQAATCTEPGFEPYVTCSRCDYTTYTKISALGHRYTDTTCERCGIDNKVVYSWDISAAEDGSVMAYCYAITDGYLLDIVGAGAMKDWENYDGSPWYSMNYRITKLRIGEQITHIGAYAFHSMSNVTLVTIPDSVQSAGNYAFYFCSKMTLILEHTTLPAGFATQWCYYAAYYVNPREVYIEQGNTYVVAQDGSVYLAKYGNQATTVRIDDKVTHIGDYAFYGRSDVKLVYVLDSVVGIGTNAFNSFSVIFEGSALPASLGQGWAGSCAYYVNPKNVVTLDGALYMVDQSDRVYLVRYFGNAQSVVIADTVDGCPVTHIGDYAFQQCSNLVSVTLPDSVCSIGKYAFAYCGQLQSMTVPDGVQSIGGHAFYNCEKMQNIELPNTLKTIGEWVFWYCKSLKNVVLPEGLTTVGTLLFGYCDKMESAVIPGSLQYIADRMFKDCNKLKHVVISDGVKSISSGAFDNCYALESIVIPASVTSISSGAFSSCTGLKLVVVKSIAVANAITYASAQGGFCASAITVVIPADATASTYLIEAYPITEAALIDGAYYTIYSKAAHSFEDTTIVEMETCVIDGLIHHVCADCGVRKDTVIACHDKLYHDAKAPTCTEIGWGAYETCTRCDYTTYSVLAATGHSYTASIVTPSCTLQGYTLHTCLVCGDAYVTDMVGARGHTAGDWIVDVSATCEEKGSRHTVCTVCGVPLVVEEISATGHTPGAWVTDVAATCLEAGSEHTACTVCIKMLEQREIPAAGHVFDDEADAVCNVCGHMLYVPGDIDGHEGVTSNDAIYLLMNTFYPESYPLDQPCDFDGSGNVDSGDAIYLLMHSYFPEYYPLITVSAMPLDGMRREEEEP